MTQSLRCLQCLQCNYKKVLQRKENSTTFRVVSTCNEKYLLVATLLLVAFVLGAVPHPFATFITLISKVLFTTMLPHM